MVVRKDDTQSRFSAKRKDFAMIQTTRIAANSVAEKLFAAEAAIDAAIAAVATLTASMPSAIQDANLGFHVGQEAIMHSMESCAQLVKSRTNMVRTHSALLTAQHSVGLGAVAFNDMNCPPSAELATQQRHLSAVAA